MNYIFYLFLLLTSFLLMSMYDLYSAFLPALLFLLVPLALFALGWAARKYTRLSLSAPSQARQGEALEIAVIAKSRLLPFVSSLTCRLGNEEYNSYEEEAGEIRFYFTKDAAHCGRLALGDGEISFRDPFGLFHFRLPIKGQTLLVMPQVIGNRDATLRALLSLSTPEEKEYFGATPYKVGDNPRLINWKVTARKEDVYVRESDPAGSARLILAADYEADETLRDTVCDALYSAGRALAASRLPFHFAWVNDKGAPILSAVESEEDWEEITRAFLTCGGAPALKDASLPPLPICYITGHEDAPASRAAVLWCAKEGNPRAALAGRAAIFHALGGQR